MNKKGSIELISALLILLWMYAAVSKLLTYDTFVVQLGKSPLVSDYASTTGWAIPVAELFISFALLLKRFRLPGLYASFFLLILFTGYLIAILNFSYHIPCSCGGILGNLSWHVHIAFNLVYSLIAVLGVVLYARQRRETVRYAAQDT